jgi:hypothetical protein
MANRKAVGLGDFVNVVSRNQASGPGHILDNDGRISRDVFPHVPGNGAGVGVKASSSRKADDNTHGFPSIERLLRVAERALHQKKKEKKEPSH